ncbi:MULTISPECIES: ScbA/BarX family gamma-butyrolactone biosynthesis protein [unclassified Streptomyces]|uniref:ScbA/BarX family gamma-butyrolactone biosynthesis protein n=1 Tax=unclassified Streptomyces TaxID=2593676 RepID=UPI0022541658|nr:MULTISPECIES: ScbA/BarX family gamma-butyrolactone biosynthesis protein [unclassified Streptomyces]MCX4884367.1 ScbA/BarX family gamma-butyrolactone biosynthesis protein [Streptomyces sp. NBC_00847]MCX5051821.1 ScbA/BarX family gamma-butyrolactone biosynthesis protein [Streptomyces sp. NBC_00474]MCX5062151.1 ScbA/BarX family gamma-butyrolactone biosynthesis protein [Streptomyces sp. NBC_00452]MCX5249715.1 ScbA/BarX family gamma-butyrolactone biosynthesis protein [Streptomyces sp. NBC_00201]
MPQPILTATVPRQLVHRAAVAETFLTDWKRTGADRFRLFAQWPRAHQLHVSPDRSAYEPLLVAETVRQCGALLAHAAYDAPLDHCFVLKELRLSTCPEHLAVGAAPAEPVLDVTVFDVRHRAGRPTALRYDTVVRLGGERVASAHIAVSWTSESVYRRLRGGRTAATVCALPLPSALPAGVVGRALPTDVVLAPPDRHGRRQLRVDTAHPVFFDHPLDHVPGMLLLEAARQAARARTADPAGSATFHAAFHQYAELDRPTWIEVTEGHGTGLEVRGRQGESTVFECLVDAVAR